MCRKKAGPRGAVSGPILMKTNQSKTPSPGVILFFAWSFLAFAALCLVRVVLDVRLAALGIIADGVVTKIEMTTSYGGGTTRRSGELYSDYQKRRSRSSASTSYHATVHFTPEGGEARDFKTVSTFGHDLKVGDAVKVIHLDPGFAEIYSAKQVWLPLGVGIIVTTVCGGLGWFLRRIVRRMKSAGVPA